jgi:hypothetical protein
VLSVICGTTIVNPETLTATPVLVMTNGDASHAMNRVMNSTSEVQHVQNAVEMDFY